MLEGMTKKNIIFGSITIILIISTILVSIFYTSKQSTSIPDDVDSDTRNKNINETFTEFMGFQWPYMLIIFYVLLVIIGVLLYFSLTKTDGVQININDKLAKILKIVFIVFSVLLVIAIIGVSSLSYIKDVQHSNQELSEYDKEQNKEKRKQFVIICVTVVVVLTGMIFMTKFLLDKIKK